MGLPSPKQAAMKPKLIKTAFSGFHFCWLQKGISPEQMRFIEKSSKCNKIKEFAMKINQFNIN